MQISLCYFRIRIAYIVHAMPAVDKKKTGWQTGIKCHKVTRPPANWNCNCNKIVWNVSISGRCFSSIHIFCLSFSLTMGLTCRDSHSLFPELPHLLLFQLPLYPAPPQPPPHFLGKWPSLWQRRLSEKRWKTFLSFGGWQFPERRHGNQQARVVEQLKE